MLTITANKKPYAENVLQQLWQRCTTEELCDVVLIVGSEKKRIPAHRIILSVACEYFDRMFMSSMRESNSKEVEMPSLNGDILQRIVEYFYTGCVTVSGDIAAELLQTAHMLLLSSVVSTCEKFFVNNAYLIYSNDCFKLAQIAELCQCGTLLKKANEYIFRNYEEICERSEFFNLEVEQLSQLLASDDLNVKSEESVFNSLMAWIDHNETEREQHKATLLKLVRLPLLNRSFLVNHVKPICTSDECRQIYMEALEFNSSSGIQKLNESKFTKPRESYQFLMDITFNQSDNKMFIRYFCPQKNEWKKWLNHLEYRQGSGVAFMESDLFIVGGRDAKDNILNTVICLNLKTMTHKNIEPMHENREWCSAAALNGCLYVVGGINASGLLHSSVERFDPKTNKWETVASLSVEHSNIDIALLKGKLCVFGGWKFGGAMCYDPIGNVWQTYRGLRYPIYNGLTIAEGGDNEILNIYLYKHCRIFRGKSVVLVGDKFKVVTTSDLQILIGNTSFNSKNFCYMFSYSDELLTTEFI